MPHPDHALRCDHCGDVIGVYEPTIVVTGTAVRRTSTAAEPGLATTSDRRFHQSCFTDRGGDQPAAGGDADA